MGSSLIIDVVIGVVFVFFIVAMGSSAATEAVARFLGLRGKQLLQGVRSLVDGYAKDPPATKDTPTPPQGAPQAPPNAAPAEATAKLFSTPVLRSIGQECFFPQTAATTNDAGARVRSVATEVRALTADRTFSRRGQLRALPAYVSSRQFAQAVLDLVVPDGGGTTTLTEIQKKIDDELDPGILRDTLSEFVKNANGSVDRFRESIEHWYDDHMERVSGWYKRRTRAITLLFGALLVLVFNVNLMNITSALYSDQALRESVVTVAFQESKCTGTTSSGGPTPVDCLRQVRDQIGRLGDAGMPVFWRVTPACRAAALAKKDECAFFQRFGVLKQHADAWGQVGWIVARLLGFAATALAVVPGARFWFDLLNKLNTLRSTGPKPATS